MKHGKKPTRRQKMKLKELHLNCDNWFVITDTSKEFVIKHKVSGQVRRLNYV